MSNNVKGKTFSKAKKSETNCSNVPVRKSRTKTPGTRIFENTITFSKVENPINKDFEVKKYSSQTITTYKSTGFSKVTTKSVTQLINLFEPKKIKPKVASTKEARGQQTSNNNQPTEYSQNDIFTFSKKDVEDYENESDCDLIEYSSIEYGNPQDQSPLGIMHLADAPKRRRKKHKIMTEIQLPDLDAALSNSEKKGETSSYIDTEITPEILKGKTSWSKLKNYGSLRNSQKLGLIDSNLNNSDYSLIRKLSWSKLGGNSQVDHHVNNHHIAKKLSNEVKPILIEKSEVKGYAADDEKFSLKTSESFSSYDSQISFRTVIERSEFEFNKKFNELRKDLFDINSLNESPPSEKAEITSNRNLDHRKIKVPFKKSSNTIEHQKIKSTRTKELEEYRLAQLEMAKEILEDLAFESFNCGDHRKALTDYVDQAYRFSDESELDWSSDDCNV